MSRGLERKGVEPYEQEGRSFRRRLEVTGDGTVSARSRGGVVALFGILATFLMMRLRESDPGFWWLGGWFGDYLLVFALALAIFAPLALIAISALALLGNAGSPRTAPVVAAQDPPPTSVPRMNTGASLENGAWTNLVEECVDLVDELDRHMAGFDPPRREVAGHVILRLQEILGRSGVEVISGEVTFDPNQHKPDRPGTRAASETQDENVGAQADSNIGTPAEDTSTWDGMQNYDDTCAVRCQEFILEQFTGTEVDEAGLVQTAADNGWYTPGGGTDPEDVGKLFELYGVPTSTYENANAFNLANELAQGHKVIINVDSGELWNEEDPVLKDVASRSDVDGADHAVVVSGIDTSDPTDPQVILSDPGTGEARAHYPMDEFLAAWQDSDFTMTATQDPAPSTLPEMSNFDYEAGHIPTALGMPYDQLAQFEQVANDEQHPAQPALDRWVDWYGGGQDPDLEEAYSQMDAETAGLHRQVDQFVNETRTWMQDNSDEIAAGGGQDFVQAVNNRPTTATELENFVRANLDATRRTAELERLYWDLSGEWGLLYSQLEEYNHDFEALQKLQDAGHTFSQNELDELMPLLGQYGGEVEKRLPPGRVEAGYAGERQRYWKRKRDEAPHGTLQYVVADQAFDRYALILDELLAKMGK
jgi:hypothetical protein